MRRALEKCRSDEKQVVPFPFSIFLREARASRQPSRYVCAGFVRNSRTILVGTNPDRTLPGAAPCRLPVVFMVPSLAEDFRSEDGRRGASSCVGFIGFSSVHVNIALQ